MGECDAQVLEGADGRNIFELGLRREQYVRTSVGDRLEHLTSEVRNDEGRVVRGESTLVLLDGDLINARRIFWFRGAIIDDLSALLGLPKENFIVQHLHISGSKYWAIVEMRAVGQERASALVDTLNGMMARREECIEWTVLEYATIRVITESEASARRQKRKKFRDIVRNDSTASSDTLFEFSAGVTLSGSLQVLSAVVAVLLL